MKNYTYCLLPFLALTILLLTSACSSSPDVEIEIPEDIAAMENVALFSSQEPPLHNITFDRLAVYGDTDDFFFGMLSDVVADETGRVFVSDGTEAVIHIYDGDGTHLQTIGGKGEGPGEFSSIYSMRLNDNFLYAPDMMQRRITIFDLNSLDTFRTIEYGSNPGQNAGFPQQFFPLGDERLLLVTANMNRDGDEFTMNHSLSVTDYEGKTLAEDIVEMATTTMTVVQGENMIQALSMPYQRRSIITGGPDNRLYHANTGRMLIEILDTEGELQQAIYYDHPAPLLNRSAILERYAENEAMYEAARKQDMPDTMPVLAGMIIDDESRIWLKTVTEDPEISEWWVLNEEGERLAAFEWPEARNVRTVKNGYLYAIEENDLGLREAIKYGFHLE